MDTKVTVAGAIGAGVGALQTPVFREFVDKKYPTINIPALKGFGTPSALSGMIGGGAGLAVGAIGMSKGKDGRQRLSDIYVAPAIDYGIVALISGILSGLYPAVTEADCVAKGGYWYNGACHKNPPTGTVSMENRPMVQQAYTPPGVMQSSVDMNLLKQMSAEIQRLSQENAQIRAQVQAAPQVSVYDQSNSQYRLPGTVFDKHLRYGFMDTEQPVTMQPAPGYPTEAARRSGFMDARGHLVPEPRSLDQQVMPYHAPPYGGPLAPVLQQPGQPTNAARRSGFMNGSKMQSVMQRFDFMGT